MIQNKKDYYFYMEADRIISGRNKKSNKNRLIHFLFPDHIAKFLHLLRTIEYYKNCRLDFIGKLIGKYYQIKFDQLSIKLGFSIPPNVFGPGLHIPHYGTIVVNSNTKVGANCVLHTCVCIAGEGKVLGNNVYISTGVIITGDIKVTNNITISANSLVNKSFENENLLIGGSPARVIKESNAWFHDDVGNYENRVHEIAKLKLCIYK